MKKGIIITVVSLLIVVLIGVNVFKAQKSEDVQVSVTSLKDMTLRSTVMIPGTLKLADEQYVYYQPENGEIEDIKVTEGTRVQVGTPIVTYTNDDLELEKEQNKLGEKSNELQVSSLNKQIAKLKDKQKKLEKELPKEEAKAQIEEERTQLNLDLETAKIEAERNKLERKSLTKKENNLTEKSELAGTVLSVDKEAAHNTSEVQKPLIHIGNTDQYLATGVLSEYDALNIEVGQPVKITSDVVPDKEWEGSVQQVDFLPQQSDAASGGDAANQYPVQVKVTDEGIKSIRPGFKLLLEIETESKKAKAVPSKAIVNEGDEKYVYIVKDGKAVKREVKVGQTTNKSIEIVKGVTSKDQIISNPSNELADGVEVTVK